MKKEVIEIEVRADDAVKDVNKLDNEFKQLDKSVKKLDKSLDKVGDESKKAGEGIEEVTKNGGAIAILDQLTGGLATRFRDAFEATKLFNFSLKGTKTALIATGVGAFIVALGLVVAYWDDIVEFIEGANKALQKQITLQGQLIDRRNSQLTLLKKEEALLKAQGVSTEEIAESQRKKTLELINQNILYSQQLEKQLLIEQAEARKLSISQKAFNVLRASLGQSLVLVGEIDEEEKARITEIEAKIQKAKEATLDFAKALVELDKPVEGKSVVEDVVEKATGERKEVVPIGTQLANDQEIIDNADQIKAAKERETGFALNTIREEIRQEDLENARLVAESEEIGRAHV